MTYSNLSSNDFESKVKNKKFVITCELGPPKGVDIENIIENVNILKGVVDAINVSDNQASNMKLGALATSHLLIEMDIEPIYQITCRDRNRLALQSDLLSAHVLGIKNILILTGDYPTIGDHPQAMPVFDLDSVQLLYATKKLEDGFDMVGNSLCGKPVFFKGAVLNTEVYSNVSFELQLIKMRKKVEAGAQFFQTMPVFNAENFFRFKERADNMKIRVPIIAGILLVKSENMGEYINKYIPGIRVPDEVINKIKIYKDKISISIDIAVSIINKIKPFCSGIHIGAQGWEKHISKLITYI